MVKRIGYTILYKQDKNLLHKILQYKHQCYTVTSEVHGHGKIGMYIKTEHYKHKTLHKRRVIDKKKDDKKDVTPVHPDWSNLPERRAARRNAIALCLTSLSSGSHAVEAPPGRACPSGGTRRCAAVLFFPSFFVFAS